MNRENFELLLPVGQKEMALAAIHNGADAIFLGFPGFNARGRSYDFEIAELKEIIETCHLYGVKVNLAFNIVIFENEILSVIEALKKVLPLKPDALIIQDLGLVQIVRALAPLQAIHASTQMTITNELAIELLNDLKIKRFVLGRENSLAEIKQIAEKTTKELEVFVHGALCVSYSGQCFTSESLGGRSANRGQCAQSCRFSYDLIVDGEKKDLVDRNYLVSPQDLCGISEIPALMKLGVKSFKVEGRLKTPEYVASVASSFRQAIDSVINNNPLSAEAVAVEKNKMAVNYSRGFFSGWLNGVNHQKLVDGTFSSHRGALIGTIVDIKGSDIIIELNQNIHLKNGDGLLWVEENENKGSFIFSIEKLKQNLFKVGLSKEIHVLTKAIGSKLYLNHDKDQKKEIQKSFTDKNILKKIFISYEINMALDEPLQVTVTDGFFSVTDQTDSKFVLAEKKPLSVDNLKEEFSSLGGSIFKVSEDSFILNFKNEKNLFISHKEIKNLRQRLIQKLTELRTNNKVNTQNPDEVFGLERANNFISINQDSSQNSSNDQVKPLLNILLRNKKQVSELIEAINQSQLNKASLHSVCLDFEFGRDYAESLQLLKGADLKAGLATTRILKPQEFQNLKIIHSLNPDFILVRNLGALHYYKQINPFKGELKGDFSLNVTNHLTAQYLLNKGLSSVCISYDLNFQQTLELIKNCDARQIEITVHQSMPSFHMEHCVFAAFLSQGTSYKDCGKPCEKHHVQLKDQFGNAHWIKPDQECRNTMYNASAQTALQYLPDWMKLNLGQIRFEALHESGTDLIFKINQYIKFLTGAQSVSSTIENLQTSESYGLSPKQLAKKDEYKSRKKDHHFLER